jgi:hypothetical protein
MERMHIAILLISLCTLVVSVVILSKVNKSGSVQGYKAIHTKMDAYTDGSKGTYVNGSVANCNSNLSSNQGMYYCDGQIMDPTDDNAICPAGSAVAIIPDKYQGTDYSGYLGSCSNPINAVVPSNSEDPSSNTGMKGSLCLMTDKTGNVLSNVPFGIVTDNCAGSGYLGGRCVNTVNLPPQTGMCVRN